MGGGKLASGLTVAVSKLMGAFSFSCPKKKITACYFYINNSGQEKDADALNQENWTGYFSEENGKGESSLRPSRRGFPTLPSPRSIETCIENIKIFSVPCPVGRKSIDANQLQKQSVFEIGVDFSRPVRLQDKRLCRNQVVLQLEKGEIVVGTNTIRLHRVFRATPERIYQAFLDADAMVKWLPPNGFTGKVHHMEAKVGGSFKMSFTNFTTGKSHSFGGQYLELVPHERIRYTDNFDDPNLPGEIRVTVTLKKVSCGTEVNIVQEGVPDVIPAEACYLGWQESLILLGKLVEAEIPE
jgi:uncharacterized protein YndB with AHSA1/START domain